MTQLDWLRECMKGRLKWFWLAMGLAVLSAGLYVVFPFVTQQITDLVLVGQTDADGNVVHNLEILPTLLVVLVSAQLLRSGVRFGIVLILENVSQNVQQEIRMHLYKNLCTQDSGFYHNHRTGDLMTRLTSDLDMVRHTIAWISYNMVESVSLFVIALAYLFTVNATLTWAMLAIMPVILLGAFFYAKTVYPLYRALRERLSELNSTAQENIEGNKTVRVFVREVYEQAKFDKANAAYRDANKVANFHWLKYYPLIELCSQCMGLFAILIGGWLIIDGKMTLGDLAAFTLLTRGLSDPMRALGIYLNDLQRFFTSASKVMELYYAQSRIVSPANGIDAGIESTPERGIVEFKNVTLRYQNAKEPALHDISLRVEQGQTVVVMGATGSGKTTLLDTVSRLLDVSSGQVLVNGIDVRSWNLQALRARVGIATQRVLLYSDTIAANIAYACPGMDETDPESVRKFAHLAAADFVEKTPEGYDTVIGEQGMGLSGGQKQRIALARALAKQPEILLLDDTTSAVDNETEKQLRENLQSLPYPCTKIIVAQRVSTAQFADVILVLEKGNIAQCGTHEELAAQDGYYRDICRLQGVQGEVG